MLERATAEPVGGEEAFWMSSLGGLKDASSLDVDCFGASDKSLANGPLPRRPPICH